VVTQLPNVLREEATEICRNVEGATNTRAAENRNTGGSNLHQSVSISMPPKLSVYWMDGRGSIFSGLNAQNTDYVYVLRTAAVRIFWAEDSSFNVLEYSPNK